MSDPASPTAGMPPPGQTPPVALPHHPPFPVARVLYAFGFGVVAWFVLHILFFLAVVQVALIAINGHPNDELKRFCASMIQYEGELFAYVTFASDAQPFPLGPFPNRS
ncbi:MAG: DUF4389 domain-containing protein [Alphaproteobacteria bacterium]|nr:DUF4389 domain-containing protein [Alphaproteobacteria bacterium]MBL6940151.1 DUF4389 domain-containing protein [Alphaproteobacteria bacterium]MBL7100238.1 DUF4389 domain-containing protein [Alphaproteobacteria bacterium]